MKQNKKAKDSIKPSSAEKRLLPSLNCIDEIRVRNDTYANYEDHDLYGYETSYHDDYNDDDANDESLSIDDSHESFKQEQHESDRIREEKSDCKLPKENNEATSFVNSFQEDFSLISEQENDTNSTGEVPNQEQVIESNNNDECWDLMSLDKVLETSTNDTRIDDYSIGSASNDWDAISSIGSVMSMYTWQSDSMVNKVTYIDALKKKSMYASGPVPIKSIPQIASVLKQRTNTNVSPSIIEDECYCNDDVSGFDERNGYKFSRGGKSSYWYGRQHKGLGKRFKLLYKTNGVIRKSSAPGGNQHKF